ncbi:MAG: Holliday junction branch migration protein RuvA [Clostridiales bacterium]|jgi:Holliday junction DNA helicase RuvA|nr:Holliday junction branch migration protein RuvA [Clostridiales bacterium]
MIAFVKGVVESLSDGQAVIEQSGIGYLTAVPGSVLSRLTVGKEVKLLTYLQVKEDGMTLFGFLTAEERAIFLRLLSVSGVGPKAALSLLTAMTPEQIILAVITGDAISLSRAPGVGKKLAARLTLELKDKLRGEAEAQDLGLSPQASIGTGSGPKQDAIDALTSLGYGRGEAVRAVMEVYVPDLDAEQTIKLALRKLAN